MKDIALVITTASPEVLPFISCKGMSPKLVKVAYYSFNGV